MQRSKINDRRQIALKYLLLIRQLLISNFANHSLSTEQKSIVFTRRANGTRSKASGVARAIFFSQFHTICGFTRQIDEARRRATTDRKHTVLFSRILHLVYVLSLQLERVRSCNQFAIDVAQRGRVIANPAY